MTPAILACILLLPPVAPGQPERPHEPALQATAIKMSECEAHRPAYQQQCAKNHADTIRKVRGRVVTQCREVKQ